MTRDADAVSPASNRAPTAAGATPALTTPPTSSVPFPSAPSTPTDAGAPVALYRVSSHVDRTPLEAGSFAPAVSLHGDEVVFVSRNDAERTGLRKFDRLLTSSAWLWTNDFDSATAPRISDDSSIVVFRGTQEHPDAGSSTEILIFDDVANTLSPVSGGDGGAANGVSFSPDVTDDGVVVFASTATDLVHGDDNAFMDVFIRDATGHVESPTAAIGANGASGTPRISADGEFIVFQSDANNLLASGPNADAGFDGGVDATTPTGPGVSNHTEIFAYARSGGFEWISRPSADATGPDGDSRDPAVSSNGTFVAFSSRSEALMDGDDNGVEDVFVTNRILGVTLRVSVSSAGEPANEASRHPSISNDGRYVVFESAASNLVPGDDNGVSDVFIHDLITSETSRVSVTALGAEANGGSFNPDLSGDGRFVAFESLATNLLSDDEELHGVRHIYLTEPRR